MNPKNDLRQLCNQTHKKSFLLLVSFIDIVFLLLSMSFFFSLHFIIFFSYELNSRNSSSTCCACMDLVLYLWWSARVHSLRAALAFAHTVKPRASHSNGLADYFFLLLCGVEVYALQSWYFIGGGGARLICYFYVLWHLIFFVTRQ